jgi:hypothetical protein
LIAGAARKCLITDIINSSKRDRHSDSESALSRFLIKCMVKRTLRNSIYHSRQNARLKPLKPAGVALGTNNLPPPTHLRSPTYPVLETNSPIPVSKFPFVQSDPELAYGTLACISHQNQPSLSQSVVRSENTAVRSNQIKKHLQKPSYKSRSTAPWSASCNTARIGRYPDLRGRRLRRLRFARSGQSKCRSQILFTQVLAGDD